MTMERPLKFLGSFSKYIEKSKIDFDLENRLKSLCWFWLLGKYWFKWSIWCEISFILNCELKERTRSLPCSEVSSKQGPSTLGIIFVESYEGESFTFSEGKTKVKRLKIQYFHMKRKMDGHKWIRTWFQLECDIRLWQMVKSIWYRLYLNRGPAMMVIWFPNSLQIGDSPSLRALCYLKPCSANFLFTFGGYDSGKNELAIEVGIYNGENLDIFGTDDILKNWYFYPYAYFLWKIY